MSNVISMENLNKRSYNDEWLIVKVDKQGNETKSIHKPKLAKILAKQYEYRQFQKMDYVYNGKCFDIEREVEFMQKKIMKVLDKEELNYNMSTVDDILRMMRGNNTVREDNSREKYLALEDCIINLQNMNIERHSPNRFTTLLLNTNYKQVSEEEYRSSNLYKYLSTVFQFDDELINQSFEVLGMCLAPNPEKFQKAVILEGEGSNGKSMFLKLVEAIVGKNYSSVSLKRLDNDKHCTSDMLGCNVNIDDDASGDKLSDTETFKKITVGGSIGINPKSVKGFNAKLDILFIACVNKMPLSKDKSHGYSRRFNILPFMSTFVDNEYMVDEKRHVYLKDKNLLPNIIKNELHILVYKALEGLQRVKRNNYSLSSSKAVEEATTAYRIKNNNVEGFFLDNKQSKLQPYPQIPAKALYEIYREWCENNETSPTTKNQFGAIAKNFCDKKRISGGYVYLDVTLHHDSEWLRQKEYI